MLDAADSQDDRLAMRRARRWRRRGRIAGPLLAVPVVLGLLLLSVDLIEYQPSTHIDPRQASTPDAAPVTPNRSAADPFEMALAPESTSSVAIAASPLSEAIGPIGSSAPAPAIDRLAAGPGARSHASRP